jgi:tetratricopeptide (TPR) repeat protein
LSVVVSLEVTSTGEPMLGILRVKLCEQVDTDTAAITMATSGERQIDCPDCLDNASSFQNSTPDEGRTPANIGGDQPTISSFLLRFGTALRLYFRGFLTTLQNFVRWHKAIFFNAIGDEFSTAFERYGDITNLEIAIFSYTKAVELTHEGHPQMSAYLTDLGNSQHTRFQRLGALSDLENAVSHFTRAVELTEDEDPDKATYLSSLAIAQSGRFERFGDLSDLENSVSHLTTAVELAEDQHPNKAAYLSNLANSQLCRFEHLGDLSDFENAVSQSHKGMVTSLNKHTHTKIFENENGKLLCKTLYCFGA